MYRFSSGASGGRGGRRGETVSGRWGDGCLAEAEEQRSSGAWSSGEGIGGREREGRVDGPEMVVRPAIL